MPIHSIGYGRSMDGQTSPRATVLALVSLVAAPFWQNRKVEGTFWFEQPQQAGQ